MTRYLLASLLALVCAAVMAAEYVAPGVAKLGPGEFARCGVPEGCVIFSLQAWQAHLQEAQARGASACSKAGGV